MNRGTISGAPMLDKLISYGLQYAGYLLQVLLLVVLTARGHWRRLVGVSLYVVLFVSIDSVARPCVLFRYGIASPNTGTCTGSRTFCWFSRRSWWFVYS